MKNNNLSFFYNHTTQQTIDADCNSLNYLQWLIDNINKFTFLDSQKMIKLYQQKNEKVLKYEILKQNISYVHANRSYTTIMSLNIDNAKEILNIINEKMPQNEVFISLEDIRALFLNNQQLQQYFTTGQLSSDTFESYIESNKELNQIIEELKHLPFVENMYVFGSSTRGKRCPQDVDVWIDFPHGDINLNDKEKIISIIKKYSYRLDCYLNINNEIWGANINVFQDECEWLNLTIVKPEAVKNWEKNKDNFVSLSQFPYFPTTINGILGKNFIKKYKY